MKQQTSNSEKIKFKGKSDNLKKEGDKTLTVSDAPAGTKIKGEGQEENMEEVIELNKEYPVSDFHSVHFISRFDIDSCLVDFKIY